MKENTLNKILVACCLSSAVITGCKARKVAIVSKPPVVIAPKPANTIQMKLAPIRAQQVSFNTFSGKARTNLNIDGNTNDCTLNIRISNNKKIWVSITALLGIEVARAIITPDSIQVINRLQSVYLKKPFSFIYQYTNRHINYNMVQSLLVGNAIPALLNDSTRYDSANNNITLTGNLQDVLYKLMVGADMKVTQTSLQNGGQGQSLQVSNTNFMMSGDKKNTFANSYSINRKEQEGAG